VADRVDRRRALYVTQGALAVQASVLATLTALGWIQPWHLAVLALWQGVANAFDIPLRQSLVVHMVHGRDDLANAIALNSFVVNGARVAGPALAGVLLAVTTEAACFAINALSYIAVFVAISRIAFPADAGRRHAAGWRRSWADGFRYVSGFAPARAMLLLVAILAWTIIPYVSLMPVFAKDLYGGGPGTLGLLLASGGAGALVATLYLAGRRSVLGLGRVIAGAAAAAGLALAAFAYLRWLPLALPLLFVFGGGVILAAASANTILQTIVDDSLRGRVSAFYMLAFLGTAPLGNLAAGALAARIGAPATFLINGLIAFVAALVFLRELPALRRALRPVYEKLGLLRETT
jgi:MFS family permease